MKKIYLIIISAILAYLIVVPSSGNKALASEEVNITTEQSTVSAPIKYDLAYPGILPDSPLYKIKVLRDKLIGFMISDPQKKIGFYLLQTDKGILATAILIDKNEIKLAGTTALKAENNYTLLVGQLYRLPKNPAVEADIIKRLKLASSKHQEVLSSLIERVPASERKVFENVLLFSKENLKSVENFQKRKRFLTND